MRPTGLEVADIFRQIGPAYRQEHADSLSRGQRRVMTDIERCRTAALGGHVEQCDACGHQRIAFNSCRDRHCPKCQSLARAQWMQDRQAELLPVEYFHVVFTVPQQIAAIAYQNKAVVYGILFRATAETLAHHRRRSQAPGRRDRLLRRAAHLGPDPPASSAFALCRARRRPVARWPALDLLSEGVGAGANVHQISRFENAHGSNRRATHAWSDVGQRLTSLSPLVAGIAARMALAARRSWPSWTKSLAVAVKSSCNAGWNRWATSPASNGDSAFKRSCNATTRLGTSTRFTFLNRIRHLRRQEIL